MIAIYEIPCEDSVCSAAFIHDTLSSAKRPFLRRVICTRWEELKGSLTTGTVKSWAELVAMSGLSQALSGVDIKLKKRMVFNLQVQQC